MLFVRFEQVLKLSPAGQRKPAVLAGIGHSSIFRRHQ
jgi:hypothetical protein